MRTLMIATALMFSSAAMAQDMGSQSPPGTSPSPTQPGPMQPGDGMAPPPADSAPPPPMDPGATPPMDPAGPPPEAMQSGAPMPAAQAPAAGDTANYPKCSRTVTDRCVNRSGR